MSVAQRQGARQRGRNQADCPLTTISTDLFPLKQESNDPNGFEFLDGQITLTASKRLLIH